MLAEEQAKINALWKIQIRRADTEELIREQTIKNVVTDLGKEFVAHRYVTRSLERITWVMVLGTGTGTPASTDTNLWSPVDASEKGGSLTRSGNIVQYYVRYLPEDANGYTYTEAGIYDQIPVNAQPPLYPKGKLINHVLIDPAIQKTADILVDFYVQIQFT